MILAIDIGNSNVVVGCFRDNEILMVERLATNRNATALEYAVLIKTVLELNGFSHTEFEGGIVSSVVPTVTNAMKDAVTKLIGKAPLVIGPGLKTGLKIRIDNAAQLGSDRVTDAVAAVEQYPCPLIIIDMGTATTISVVDKDKNFIGGIIMPGLRISSEALAGRASQLPQISLDPPKNAIGRNTVDCMRSGIILGAASTIDGLIDHIQEELGYSCTVVATGGNSRVVMPYCNHAIIWDDQLLLKGLRYIYWKNQ